MGVALLVQRKSDMLSCMTIVHRLVLIRHAQAQQTDDGNDHERTLTDRGRADAESLGHWLREKGVSPQETWCSTSARTRETWAAIVDASGMGGMVDHEKRIYNADPDELLRVVNELDPTVETVALVGHAPGIPILASELAGGKGDADALAQLELSYPTCTVAVLDVDGEWADAGPGGARLVAMHTARA